MKDEEILSILKTKNEIDLSDIFLNYYRQIYINLIYKSYFYNIYN